MAGKPPWYVLGLLTLGFCLLAIHFGVPELLFNLFAERINGQTYC